MKYFSFIFVAFALLFISTVDTQADFKKGAYGITAGFAGSSGFAQGVYVIGKEMQLDLGLMFSSESYSYDDNDMDDPDSESTFGLMAGLKYFLDKPKDVVPYLAGSIKYISYPTHYGSYVAEISRSLFGFEFGLGCEAFIIDGFAVFGQINLGIGFDMEKHDIDGSGDYTLTTTKIGLSTISLGATYYID